ncbi:unnamed protein product [Lathyrus sativus]|nr:unnamed protein product [Lathyrus sativus]
MHWLRSGDRNTTFFHCSTTARKKFQQIQLLIDDNDNEVREHNGMCNIAKDYFDNLFLAGQGVYEPVLELIQPTISADDNSKLLSPISKEELFNALSTMHPDKSPGPDGFNPAFYQKFWHLCGDDI